MSNTINFGVNNVSSSKLPPSTGVSQDIVLRGSLCSIAKAEDIVSKGNVLSQSTTLGRQLVLSPVSSDLTVVGVSTSATTTAGSEVRVAVGGEFQVLTIGAVVMGNLLRVSRTPGVAEVGTGAGTFALASNTDPDREIKLVWARFLKSEAA